MAICGWGRFVAEFMNIKLFIVIPCYPFIGWSICSSIFYSIPDVGSLCLFSFYFCQPCWRLIDFIDILCLSKNKLFVSMVSLLRLFLVLLISIFIFITFCDALWFCTLSSLTIITYLLILTYYLDHLVSFHFDYYIFQFHNFRSSF